MISSYFFLSYFFFVVTNFCQKLFYRWNEACDWPETEDSIKNRIELYGTRNVIRDILRCKQYEWRGDDRASFELIHDALTRLF